MPTYILHIPKYFNTLDTARIEVEAETSQEAVQKVFDNLPPGRGLNIATIKSGAAFAGPEWKVEPDQK